ncbi:helix-turn-helix domain-containing protein [Rhodocytophaga rosea]|uniref:Helix-turn-helix domain-containing protein n=1 Tax=Rhodocytophaga rosea TaxID=2704465 RepID=A0A6C0GTH3_9BACT|nr:helix-turn-helix domain-containing protein [Rhodocytophaga rosea]QHT70833.1 helix-turn-helix domain-containing protein [Rhodocytophaga rosea]
MKKNKITFSIPANESNGRKYHWGRLQQEWRDTLNKSGEIYFEIHRRDEYRLKSNPLIAPFRQDLYIIFLITGGEAVHNFGNQDYYLKPGILCFVSAGIFVSRQSTINEHAGYLCGFTSAFFSQNLSDKDSLLHYPFFNTEASVSLQLDTDQTSYFYNLFREMEEEYHSTNANKEELIRALLTILLQKAQRLVISDRTDCLVDNSNAGLRLTKAFTKLFEADFEPLKKLHGITTKHLSQYASNLHVTQNHLNDTIKAVSGKTPGELIRERIIKEASQLLLHTQLTIAEICFLLKFEDPSYFSRFFKRYTGLTPTQHRKQYK